MAVITRKTRPDPEYVVWDGDNEDEVLELVSRVAGLDVWPPLKPDTVLVVEVNREADTLHPGLSIINDEGDTVVRVEDAHVVVFDLFRTGKDTTPLFAMTPEHFEAFYGTET
jgi:hypothetical protein